MKQDICKCCNQYLHVKCPLCDHVVAVVNGKMASHDAGTVHAGHMTWGSCKASGAPVILPGNYSTK